jgi:hypothetical protein
MSRNPKELERQRQSQEDSRLRWESDFRKVLGTPEGRRVYWAILNRCNVFGTSYAEGASATAFNEGRRAVGIELMREGQSLASADYVLTLNEALNLQRDEANRRALADAKVRGHDDGDDSR